MEQFRKIFSSRGMMTNDIEISRHETGQIDEKNSCTKNVRADAQSNQLLYYVEKIRASSEQKLDHDPSEEDLIKGRTKDFYEAACGAFITTRPLARL